MEIIANIATNKSSIMKGITKPGIENFSKLLSSETYAVPRFQRDYSWREANWFELWEDVKSILSGEYQERFMGYLVFLQKGKTNEIIDGQQRLITISIMFLAFIENIQKQQSIDSDAARKILVLRGKYIAEETVVKGEYKTKLQLNENNNDLYRSFVTGNTLSKRRFNASEKLMQNCLQWFIDKVEALNLNSENLSKAVVNIGDSLFFTTLNVSDDLNAYIVFETLNARGVKLTSSDLLKNYLFQKASLKGNDSLNDVEIKWRRIVETIGSEDLVDFIRYFWNSRNKFVRKVDLYRAITLNNTSPDAVIDLLDQLSNSAQVYAALITPYDDYWQGNANVSEKLHSLKIFRIRQPLALLLIGKEVLNDSQFEKLLRYCVILSFRYNVICDFPANEQESFYNELALKIKKDKSFSEKDFASIYPSDDTFMNHFKSKAFLYNTQNAKIIRYTLASIEKQLTSNTKAINLFTPDMTIEHIMSQDVNARGNVSAEDHKKYLNRLGNLSILTKKEQAQADNKPFNVKAKVYKDSAYKITSEIVALSKTDWNEKLINKRQDDFSKKAKSIWAIPNI